MVVSDTIGYIKNTQNITFFQAAEITPAERRSYVCDINLTTAVCVSTGINKRKITARDPKVYAISRDLNETPSQRHESPGRGAISRNSVPLI